MHSTTSLTQDIKRKIKTLEWESSYLCQMNHNYFVLKHLFLAINNSEICKDVFSLFLDLSISRVLLKRMHFSTFLCLKR